MPWTRKSALERFLTLIEIDDNGCWRWQGHIWRSGYADFWDGDKNVRAARWAAAFTWGAHKEGETTDHLCPNKDCVNPWHLEIVSHQVNVLRSNNAAGVNARKVVCLQGHPLSGDNLYITPKEGRRQCKICRSERSNRAQQRKRAIAVSA
jgi:hypothetical protein